MVRLGDQLLDYLKPAVQLMPVLAGFFFPPSTDIFFMILTHISNNLTNLNFIFKLYEIQLDKKK